ncbi:MAG TPA: hypothetical protein K8V77_10100 [Brachyspira hyodysenteriae]|nr:hypothetical protein [Brachyspira hyodysenteriae]
MAKRNKLESNTESSNNAEDLKYKVGKGSIAYKPKGYSLSKIITVGEIIPDEVIENYKRQKVFDALIKRGTIVLCGTDLKEVEKEYVDPPSNAADTMNEIADKTAGKTENTEQEDTQDGSQGTKQEDTQDGSQGTGQGTAEQ